MASRYPLVINNSTSLVGELSIGDSLNLTSSGIFDGTSTGGNGQVLSSNNSNVKWIRAADVFLNDTQTLQNKTLSNCILDASSNSLINISNNNLLNSSININGTDVSLGGSINIPDTNDNTLYGISVADGVNATQKRIRLTAGGSGSGFQDIFLTTNGNYLSIGRTNNDTLNFSISLQNLTAGSYIIYDNSATLYNGLDGRTIAVDATASNTANKIVARDANKNFSAGTITADLIGNVTGNLTGTADKVANVLTRGSYLTGDNYDGSAARTWAVDAVVGTESARGGNKIVARDSNGDFWARNINGTTIRATASVTVDRGINPHGFLRSDGSIDTSDYITLSEVPQQFQTGTTLVFYQSSAPTGWTKLTDTGLNDTAMRIVTGSGGSFVSVTGNGFASIFVANRQTFDGDVNSHSLSSNEIPAHTHPYTLNASARGLWMDVGPNPLFNAFGASANYMNYGSFAIGENTTLSSAHDHGFTNPKINMNVNYVNCIICKKD